MLRKGRRNVDQLTVFHFYAAILARLQHKNKHKHKPGVQIHKI